MVPQTNYSKSVTVIIGTNFIRICRDVYDSQFPEIEVPDEWKLAFDSMCDETPVKQQTITLFRLLQMRPR